MTKTYFITGANRGIGFQLTSILSKKKDNFIIGTTRSDSSELSKLAEERGNIKIIKLDVSSIDSIKGIKSQLDGIEGIDVLINNAGIADKSTSKRIVDTEYDTWIDHYKVNSIGGLFVLKEVYPYLQKKETKQVFFISSLLGSLNGFYPISTSAYGQSKASLNHSVLMLDFELKGEGFTIVALHPGLVATDMGKGSADIPASDEMKEALAKIIITPEESGEALVKVIEGATIADSGKFINYDGTPAPW